MTGLHSLMHGSTLMRQFVRNSALMTILDIFFFVILKILTEIRCNISVLMFHSRWKTEMKLTRDFYQPNFQVPFLNESQSP